MNVIIVIEIFFCYIVFVITLLLLLFVKIIFVYDSDQNCSLWSKQKQWQSKMILCCQLLVIVGYLTRLTCKINFVIMIKDIMCILIQIWVFEKPFFLRNYFNLNFVSFLHSDDLLLYMSITMKAEFNCVSADVRRGDATIYFITASNFNCQVAWLLNWFPTNKRFHEF